MCDCIKLVNEQLQKRQLSLVTTIPLQAGTPSRCQVEIRNADFSKKKIAFTVVANNCPFCGEACEPKQEGK